jgi:hypothetical protein
MSVAWPPTGSKILVGLAGFEPAASATQTRRASQAALQPVLELSVAARPDRPVRCLRQAALRHWFRPGRDALRPNSAAWLCAAPDLITVCLYYPYEGDKDTQSFAFSADAECRRHAFFMRTKRNTWLAFLAKTPQRFNEGVIAHGIQPDRHEVGAQTALQVRRKTAVPLQCRSQWFRKSARMSMVFNWRFEGRIAMAWSFAGVINIVAEPDNGWLTV